MFKKTKLIRLGCLVACLIIAFCTASYFIRLGRYKKAVANMTFTPIDLTQIEDGTYTGSCDVDFVAAKVKVTVKDHAITSIDLLEHRTEKGLPAEAIINTILQRQTTDVDAISGATNSSKVIKKSIENALLSH